MTTHNKFPKPQRIPKSSAILYLLIFTCSSQNSPSFQILQITYFLPLNHSPKSSCFPWSPMEYWLISAFTKSYRLSIEKIFYNTAFCFKDKLQWIVFQPRFNNENKTLKSEGEEHTFEFWIQQRLTKKHWNFDN